MQQAVDYQVRPDAGILIPAAKTARPIRVLILRSVSGSGGGAERIILRTIERADSAKVQFTICCLRDEADAHFDFDRRVDRLHADYREIVQRGPLDRTVWPRIQEIAQSCAPDIVHAHDYKASYFASRLRRREGILPLATLHGWTGHTWRERLAYYPAEKMIVRRFPLVIAVSNQIRDELLRWRARSSAVRVVLNGADMAALQGDDRGAQRVRAELGIAPDELLIGAVGRLERQKRFDVLLRAVSELRRRQRHVRLVVAGEGSERKALDALIRELELGDVCQLLGTRDDMGNLYRAFDVLAQSSDYEGTPTVVVEAMACGTPIVATDVGGTRDLITHSVHGLLVPHRDENALAEALGAVLCDRHHAAERARQARLRVETELSFTVRTRRLTEIYEELYDLKCSGSRSSRP